MKSFSWRPKVIKRRDDLIHVQELEIAKLEKTIDGLSAILIAIRKVWNAKIRFVNSSRLGKARMIKDFSKFLDQVAPDKKAEK